MSNKIKTIIAVGGTGGHVFPGCNLAKHLEEKNYEVKMITWLVAIRMKCFSV